jgi:hypothetical protein
MGMDVAMMVLVGVGMVVRHGKMLHYNITRVHAVARRSPASQTEAASISNADRCGRSSDHPHGRVGVTGAVEVDVNDPQNEQSNKCRGYGFHKLLTVKIRHGFPGRNSHWRYEGTKVGAQDDLPPRSHPLANRAGAPHGFPITIAIAAARNGNGTETAARNQTNLAGMNGISQRIMR